MAYDPSTPEAGEPFGQAGVRKHASRILAWIGVILVAFSLAMSQRSNLFDDEFQWHAMDQLMSISSVGSRIIIRGGHTATHSGATSGWSYHSHYVRDIIDQWQPSVWKSIGFEFSTHPMPGEPAGFWVRIKWSFLAAVFAIQPILHVVLVILRWRKYRA